MTKLFRFKQLSESEKATDAVQSTFEYKDGGYLVTYIIDTNGVIWLTLPERVITATPDELRNTYELGELSTIFGGKLMDKIKKDFEAVTGKEF